MADSAASSRPSGSKKRAAAALSLPPLPPISLIPQKPVDPAAPYAFWRSIGSPRYVLAPMVNQSELAFRLLCRQYGAQLSYTPMLHAAVFCRDSKYRRDQFQAHAADRPLIAQFCGDCPLTLLQAARMVEGQVQAVDLNLGCPQGIARRGHYGAFLLRETELLRSIVATLHDHLSVPVTCKIRLLDSVQDTIALALVLQEAGCSVLTVHGRTKEHIHQKVGAADWSAIRQVKAALRIPVISNGGIGCYADLQRCLDETQCDAVMSSEAVLELPSLFSPPLPQHTPFALTQQYLALCAEHPLPASAIRPHLFKLLFRPLSVHVELRNRFGRCGREELLELVKELERADAQLDAEERSRRYEGKVSWYDRHKSYKKPSVVTADGDGAMNGSKADSGKGAAAAEVDDEKEGRKRGREQTVWQQDEAEALFLAGDDVVDAAEKRCRAAAADDAPVAVLMERG